MLLDSPQANLLIGTAYTFGMCQLAMAEKALGGSDDRVRERTKQWAAGLRARLGVEVHAEGFEAIDWSQPYIVMANHQSYLDVLALFSALPKTFGVVAKKGLFKVPFFSGVMRALGCIPIDRADRADAIAMLRAAADQVRSGSTIAVFPEGTRSAGDCIQPLKRGPFHLARLAKVPVIPVGISGTHALMPRSNTGIRSGVVRIRCGAPMRAPAGTGAKQAAFVEEVRAELGRLAGVPLVPATAPARPSVPPPAALAAE
ncbi:MAG: lysophospholipid acyltransferase family protein [Polyangiaceae bacterium]